jgi:hypothetical protein
LANRNMRTVSVPLSVASSGSVDTVSRYVTNKAGGIYEFAKFL